MSPAVGWPGHRVLVHGFGPFLHIDDNPAGRLAEAVDGASVGRWSEVGEVMPVSYSRAPVLSAARARALAASLLIGVGVATSGSEVCVEARATPEGHPQHADVDGVALRRLAPVGAGTVAATGPVDALARALGGVVSTDAGRYVCNAWLYRTVQALGTEIPVLFVHVPPVGLPPERLLAALGQIQESPDGGWRQHCV